MAGPVQFERRVYPTGAAMNLVSGVATPTDLTFTVDAVDSSVPTTGPGYIIFDLNLATEEAVRWTSRSGVTFTIPDTQSRGCGGTAATGHDPGSGNVVFGFIDADFDEANYWSNQLGQIQAPGDMYQGAGDNELQVTPIGSEGQRWVVTDGIGAWVDPELPAPATDGWVLTQDDALPVWQAPYSPLLAVAYAAGPYTMTASAHALDTTNATVSFTPGASGQLIARVTGLFASDTSGNLMQVWFALHGTSTIIGHKQTLGSATSSLAEIVVHISVAQLITGLASGTALQLDLWGGSPGPSSQTFSDVLIEIVSA